ncbi:MAG: RDD family protein [Mucilaginibacter polytrichastri]|nr:RDD family protein [Mucilaginibacter polytrichastri]
MTSASITRRILACLIDGLIFAALFALMYVLTGLRHRIFTGETGSGESFGLSLSLFIVPAALVGWLVFITLTEYRNGQSMGKRMLGIRVVGEDAAKITLRKTLVRHVFDLADTFLFAGLLIALINPEKQRIGDRIAGTRVVGKRIG